MTPISERSKKVLLGAGGAVVLALLVLLLLPLLFRGRIAERIRAEVDRAVDADVSWGAVELSLLRTFPDLTLGLREVSVVGVDRFEGDTLVALDRFRMTLALGSVVRSLRGTGPLVVREVRLEEPFMNLRVLDGGASNWDVLGARADEAGAAAEPTGTRSLSVTLRSFEVTGGRVRFESAPAGILVALDGLDHELSGDFSRDSLVARTRTRAERATVVFAGTPYLGGVRLAFDADLAVHPAEQRIAFRDNELSLNDLVLRFSGDARRAVDTLAVDVTFEAPSTDFRQILSLVPAVYAEDFESLETAGRFAAAGHVRGAFGPDAFPGFSLRASVEDGSFRYPDLPLPARSITAELAVDNPGGHVDSTVVRLERFHVEIGGQPLDAAVTVRTPVSDPDVDGRVAGTLDLDALARTVKLTGVDELSGVVRADAGMRARISDLDSARYDRVSASGTVSAEGVTLRSEGLPHSVEVEEMEVRVSPARAELLAFRSRLGGSDLSATGEIDNPLGFLLGREPLRVTGRFHSDRFILDEWKSDDEELEVIPVPRGLDLTLDGTVDDLRYEDLRMTDARGSLRVRDERLTLDGFGFGLLGGRVRMSGHYETLEPERPTFNLDLALDSVDVAGAADAFLTVRALAPVARYARGSFSADLGLSGALTPEMTPVLDALDGAGSLLTSRITIEGFPLLDRLSDAVRLSSLANPTFEALRSSVRIEDGRMHVDPFRVSLGGMSMTVEGSNGIDESLDYRLGLNVPRALMGEGADRFVQDLAARFGRTGLTVSPGETLGISVGVGGSVTDPSLELGLGDVAASAAGSARQAADAAVERQAEEARAEADSAAAEARRRARARADSLVADAERRAEAIRQESVRLAEQVRAEGDRRADEVLAQATNPLARRAAEPVANRIRREAGERADQIEREADERADAIVREARERADAIVGGGG